MMPGRILIAGIGNVFLADDGFGVEVARRLAERPQPAGVRVVDFGIRGMDLVYALLEERDACILVDTVARGGAPGTLYLIEPQIDEGCLPGLDVHGMDPVKVLALARTLGAPPTRTLLVACEPARLLDEEDEEIAAELSAPVQAAVDEAVRMVESLVETLAGERSALNGEGAKPL